MIGRTEMAQSKMRFLPYVLEKFRRQARLANPGLAANQHRMPLAGLHLLPATDQQLQLLDAADERHRPRAQGLKAADDPALADHTPGKLRLGNRRAAGARDPRSRTA